MGAPSPFEAWLTATGLVRPVDLKFAFCSAKEAAEACPVAAAEAAQAWLSVTTSQARLPSTWALWMQCRPGGAGRPPTSAPAYRAAASWTGLGTKNPRKDDGPVHDLARRQAAAKDALHEALSWKGRGRLGVEWGALDEAKRHAWTILQITRISNAEAKTIRACLRTWQHWKLWCTAQGEDPLASSEAAPAAFLHALVHPTKNQKQVPRTVPATRFHHMKWIVANMGAPIIINASHKPSRRTSGQELPPDQKAATDPEVHIQLDHLLNRLPEGDPAILIVATIQILWLSVLRFQHLQRSVPVKLTKNFFHAVCWKGKNKPGYRWACPRYGPTGTDIGGVVWRNWQQTAKGLQEPPFGLMYEKTGAAFTLQNFNVASRAVLQEHLGMQETDMFSSRSLRRSMPTLAEMRNTHPDDADALGDWTASKDSKMRIRYADSRDERAALVKAEHMLVVRHMMKFQQGIDWSTCRHLLPMINKAEVSAQANEMLAIDPVVEETPKHFLRDLVKPKRKFNIAAITAYVKVKQAKHLESRAPALAGNSPPSKEPTLPVTDIGASRRWLMVKFQGAPRVHMLPEDGDMPLCRRRRGAIGKPLVRLEGSGTSIACLNQMSWGVSCICQICMRLLPQEECMLIT